MKPILKIEDLTIQFVSDGIATAAVDNIGFELMEGETLAIIGESGSGKSAIALSIMGLLPKAARINSGKIYFGGNENEDLLKKDQEAMQHYRGKKMAMIFQEPMTSLNPVFTCGYQINEALRVHSGISKKEAKEISIKLLKEVLISDAERIYSSYPHQLSGGQKQRVMIAMAISCNPSVLIADEPTTSVDVNTQATIIELMKNLKGSHQMSMLFISHDLAVVSSIADRIIVMRKGRIVEQGTVKEIFQSPKHPYTKGLLLCRPPLGISLKRLPVMSDLEVEDEDAPVVNDFSSQSLFNKLKVSTEEKLLRLKELYSGSVHLQVRDLSVSFREHNGLFNFGNEIIKAVDHVSFDVFKGETLGVVGESGCGKSTLGKAILQLQNYSGKVMYAGKDFAELDNEEMRLMRRRIQIVFQDPYASLNPRMSIGKAIMEPMQVHRLLVNDVERKENVFRLLKKIGLSESSFHKYPHEFSGGERQRICIARALSVNPEFLICDECVSSLDVSVQAQVLNLLMDLRNEFKFTCVFISHDLSVVKFMSDRILVMKEGRVEETGSADEVFFHPVSEYTKKLIAAIPKPKVDFLIA